MGYVELVSYCVLRSPPTWFIALVWSQVTTVNNTSRLHNKGEWGFNASMHVRFVVFSL